MTWDEPISTDGSDVYWYQDSQDGSNSGFRRPAEWVIHYWDDTIQDRVDMADPSQDRTELDMYNSTTHDAVTTTAIRVTVETRDDAAAVGACNGRTSTTRDR